MRDGDGNAGQVEGEGVKVLELERQPMRNLDKSSRKKDNGHS
jgi:hypothetical protein